MEKEEVLTLLRDVLPELCDVSLHLLNGQSEGSLLPLKPIPLPLRHPPLCLGTCLQQRGWTTTHSNLAVAATYMRESKKWGKYYRKMVVPGQ